MEEQRVGDVPDLGVTVEQSVKDGGAATARSEQLADRFSRQISAMLRRGQRGRGGRVKNEVQAENPDRETPL